MYKVFFLLSGHDSSLIMMQDLLRFLFKLEINFPSFSSCLFLELEKDNENNYFVNIVFNNKTLETIYYEDFKRTILEKTWSYYQTGIYCGFIKDDNHDFLLLFCFYFILIFGIFFLGFQKFCKENKKKMKKKYKN